MQQELVALADMHASRNFRWQQQRFQYAMQQLHKIYCSHRQTELWNLILICKSAYNINGIVTDTSKRCMCQHTRDNAHCIVVNVMVMKIKATDLHTK